MRLRLGLVLLWSLCFACSSVDEQRRVDGKGTGGEAGGGGLHSGDAGGGGGTGAASGGADTGGADTGGAGGSDVGGGTGGARREVTPWALEDDLLAQTASSIVALTADPKTPRHLLVVLENNVELAIEWTNGTLLHPVISENTSRFSTPTFYGGGFDGDGNAYLYWSGVSTNPNASPFSIARRAVDGDYAWHDLPLVQFVSPAPPDWPPTAIAVDPTSPGRFFVHRESSWLLDGTSAVNDPFFNGGTVYAAAQVAATPALDSFTGAVFSPAVRGAFLVAAPSGVRRCKMAASISCDAPATGIAPGEFIVRLFWSEGMTVYANAGARKLYRWIIEGGASFTEAPLPDATRTFAKLAVAGAKDRVAIYYPYANASDGSMLDEGIYVTTNGGSTWAELTLPDTPSTDLDDLAFDAAGTLFLARGGRLFSLDQLD